MNEKQSIVSVIVPIYKVESFMDSCIESIRLQTYQHLEIILVDDGSPDSCPAKCDRWAECDERIKVIHQENGGLSAARNAGLSKASGEYVLFVDSDDWIEHTMIEVMLDTAYIYKADIVNCQFVHEKSRCSSMLSSLYPTFVKSGRDATALLCEDGIVTSHTWRNLFRRDILQDNPFPVGINYEDVYILHEIFFKSKRVVFIGDTFYHYFNNINGIVNTMSEKNMRSFLLALKRREKFILKNIPEIYKNIIKNHNNKIYYQWRNSCKEYNKTRDEGLIPFIKMTEQVLKDVSLRDVVFRKWSRIILLKLKYLIKGNVST